MALVYNLKKDGAEEVLNGSEGGERDDSRLLTAARLKLQHKRADTYAEWDTEETILSVKAALEERHTVTLIEADEDAYQKFLAVQPDIVFNIAEGFRGPSREAQIPAMLELLGIPYTGSDPLMLGICLDKSRAKEILSYYKIPTPPFEVISSLDQLVSTEIALPAIVKPLHEGSSKGILNSSVVKNIRELTNEVKRILSDYEEPALVEKFLPGREFTVALLGNPPFLTLFPVVEIRLNLLPSNAKPIYSYEAKWMWDQPDHPIEMYECPARIDLSLQIRIKEICTKTFQILRCRDWCRIDLRLDELGEPHIIELNPLPGILPNPDDHSCFPLAARTAGFNYNRMINAVLDAAISRYGFADIA